LKFILALNAIGVKTEELAPLALAAEAAGFDGVLLGDHVVMPATIRAEASYTKDGKSPMGFETAWPECLSAMAFLLGATSRLRVISSVLVLPMRNPLIVAKSVQTMAVMSGGRVVLGVGSGWMAEEFAALGAPFVGRGARTDEGIEIVRRLGTEGVVEWKSNHYDIPKVSGHPTPPSPVPIYVGGEAEAALRRAARLGDGYLSVLRTRASLKKRLARLNELREEAGRADQPFEFVGVPADASTPDDFAALEADGIGAAAVMAWQASYEKTDPPLAQKLDAIAAFGERVIRQLA
jgi:probable F420-dependent oxidoreductase